MWDLALVDDEVIGLENKAGHLDSSVGKDMRIGG